MDMKKLLISGALISGLSFGDPGFGQDLHVGRHKLKPIVQDPIVENYNVRRTSGGNICQGVCGTADAVVGYAANGTYNTVSGIYNESGALMMNVHTGVGNITRGVYDTAIGVICGEGCYEKIQGVGRGVGNTILGVAETAGYATVGVVNIATTPVRAFLSGPLGCIERGIENYCP